MLPKGTWKGPDISAILFPVNYCTTWDGEPQHSQVESALLLVLERLVEDLTCFQPELQCINCVGAWSTWQEEFSHSKSINTLACSQPCLEAETMSR